MAQKLTHIFNTRRIHTMNMKSAGNLLFNKKFAKIITSFIFAKIMVKINNKINIMIIRVNLINCGNRRLVVSNNECFIHDVSIAESSCLKIRLTSGDKNNTIHTMV